MEISVVIPVYNSEASLRPLVERLKPVLEEISEAFELILVNDGSQDKSIVVMNSLAEEHTWIRGVDLMRNSGQHNALLCGIREARYPIIATLDDDLQHPPEELPKLLERLDGETDVVYGTPKTVSRHFPRGLATFITKMALRTAMGVDIANKVSAFRVFRTELRESYKDYNGAFVSIDVLLTWATTRFAAIETRHDPREYGVSNYTFRKLATHALNLMTGFSVLPLQIASLVGFAFTFFGMAVLAYIIVRFAIHGRVVPGFAFLGSITAIFSGAQLFSLGIIGEYLARVHFQVMGRPAYVVRTVTGKAVQVGHGKDSDD